MISLIPRLFYATNYLFDGDPVNYFLGAVNLLSGQGFTAMGFPVIWPIGYSLTIIPFLLILNSPAAGVASSIIASTSALIALYVLGSRIYSKPVGFFAAVMLAFAESYFFNSVNIASDSHALLFVLLAMIQLQKIDFDSPAVRYFLPGLFIGLSALVRYSSGIFFFLPLSLLIVNYLKGERDFNSDSVKRDLRWIGIYLSGFLVALSVQMYLNLKVWNSLLPSFYYTVNEPILFTSAANYFQNLFRIIYRIGFTTDFYAPVGALLLIIGLLNQKGNERSLRMLLIFTILGAVPLLAFSVKPRFMISIMPALFLVMAYGMQILYVRMEISLLDKWKNLRIKKIAVSLIVTLFFLPHVIFSFRTAEFNKLESKGAASAFTWVKENTPSSSVVLTQSPYFGHFNVWELTGYDIWAAKYYSEREMFPVFTDIDSILTKHTDVFAVINDYWQSSENLRMMYPGKNREAVHRLLESYNVKEMASFESNNNRFLWKITAVTFHPDDYFNHQHRFTIYRVLSKK